MTTHCFGLHHTMIYDDYARYTDEYKRKYGERTVVMIEVGSFWEMYNCDKNMGADMVDVCSILNITISRKNKSIVDVSSSNPLMAGFPSPALAKFLPILVENDYTVILVGQITAPPNPKRGVVGVYSKGTWLADGIVGANATATTTANGGCSSNYIMTITIDTHVHPITRLTETCVGVAQVDISTGEVMIGELFGEFASDDMYKLYSTVEPSELLIYKTSSQCDKSCVAKVLSAAPKTTIKDYCAVGCDDYIGDRAYQEFLLKKAYLGQHSVLTIHEQLNLERMLFGTSALTALLRFVMDHDPLLLRNLKPPRIFANGQASAHMDLYYNCAEQLDLNSLIGVINKCMTPIGKRAFKQRLHTPLCCPDKIQNALLHTKQFYEAGGASIEDTRRILGGVCDLEKLFRRVCIGKIHPHELCAVMNSLRNVVQLDGEQGAISNKCLAIIEMVESAFDMDMCAQVGLDGLTGLIFRPGQDAEFDAMVRGQKEMVEGFEAMVAKWNMLCGKVGGGAPYRLERNDRDGMYVTITAKRYEGTKALVGGNSGCASSQAFLEFKKSGSTNTHIKLCSDRMKAVDRELHELDDLVLAKTKERYASYLDACASRHAQDFNEIVDFVGHTDFHCTAAFIAHKNGYVEPMLSTDAHTDAHAHAWLDAKAMRHPLVELLDVSNHAYVPNDINLKDKNRAWLLYGLNAAGKSTLMKMIALNIIMAQSGLYVPCDEFVLSPYSAIYTRISKGDDILNGQSTFMVEMSELRNILAKADEHSLVIGDELCSGTETLSAIAIVHSGIRELSKRSCSFVFATHLHELVEYFDDLPNLRICHLHVEYNPVEMKLKYDRILRDGDGPRTYGVEVCKSLGMTDEFVKAALSMRQRLENGGRLDSMPKVSKYNNNLMYDEVCEVCKKRCTRESEVHHIKHQAMHANMCETDGRMNVRGNLMVLCTSCHNKVHAGLIDIRDKVLSTDILPSTPTVIITPSTHSTHSTHSPHSPTTSYTLNVDERILDLRNVYKLSLNKISDKVYEEYGVKMNAYKISKILSNATKN